jgi:hypothetical protein
LLRQGKCVCGFLFLNPKWREGHEYLCDWCDSLSIIHAAGREKKVLCTVDLDSPTSSTPIAANGVVYLATMTKLYALQKK